MRPEWTTDRPTEPGWYWVRYAHGQAEVRRVEYDDIAYQGLEGAWMKDIARFARIPEPVEPHDGPTVRARVAVAVAADKSWAASGNSGLADEDNLVFDFLEPDAQEPHDLTFIEATLPVPTRCDPRTVEADVAGPAS